MLGWGKAMMDQDSASSKKVAEMPKIEIELVSETKSEMPKMLSIQLTDSCSLSVFAGGKRSDSSHGCKHCSAWPSSRPVLLIN